MTRTMPDQAFILTAGKGTRLRPYTDNLPKPLVPVLGKPILFHTLDKCKRDGINNIVMNTHYFGDILKSQTQNYESLNIQFSAEETLLDTGGGAKKALTLMKEAPFFMINGDALWEDEEGHSVFKNLSQQWDPKKMDILLLLQPISNMQLTKGIGDYDLADNGQAIRSKTKSGSYMFAGVRITKPSIIKDVQEDTFSFLRLMDEAESNGRLYGVIHKGAWHHISTPSDLETVNKASKNPLPSPHTTQVA